VGRPPGMGGDLEAPDALERSFGHGCSPCNGAESFFLSIRASAARQFDVTAGYGGL
jgi:hypothetical protein